MGSESESREFLSAPPVSAGPEAIAPGGSAPHGPPGVGRLVEALRPNQRNGLQSGALHRYLREVEIEEIESALDRNGWNVAATARELGVHRTGLYERLRRLGIALPKRPGKPSNRDLRRPAWPCPTCGAAAGEPCRFRSTSHPRSPHWKRRDPPEDEEETGESTEVFALRETTLSLLTEPADREAIPRLGLLHRYALDRRVADDPAICAACCAGARDLRNLQGFFDWLSREAEATERGRSGIALAESARAWGEKLGRLAASIEDELVGLLRSGRTTNA